MKKRGWIALSVTLLLALTACGNSTTRLTIVDQPSTEIKNTLKLEDVQNGVKINANLDENSETYAKVQLAENPTGSLFYSLSNLDEYLGDHFKEVRLNSLFFRDFPSSDATAFLTEMNSADYGLKTKSISLPENDRNLLGNVAISTTVTPQKEYQKVDGKQAVLAVAYLPTYCTYVEKSQAYTKVFFFVPVYYSFTYVSNGVLEDSDFADIQHYQIELTEGLLPHVE